jgi:hypothetical protein
VGRDVVLLEALPFPTGTRAMIEFETVNSPWRQGVWLGTAGALRVAETISRSLELWADTSPRRVEVLCEESETGLLTLYNIWNSGRKIGSHESQSDSSGMLVEELAGGGYRYRCQDIAVEPMFDRLVFSIRIASG